MIKVTLLLGGGVRAFIDATDEALSGFDFSPQIRKECLTPRYKITLIRASSKITWDPSP